MKRTRMNKVVCLFAASASFAAFGLTDVYWVGGTSGDWDDTANWACSDWSTPSKPDSVECHVHITNEVPVEIVFSGSRNVGSISFSGANHVITNTTTSIYLIFGVGDGEANSAVYVAEDVTATIGNVMAKADNKSDFVKKGRGTLNVVGRLCKSTNRFKSLEIAEGVFDLQKSGTFQIAGVCTVRSGAKFVTMGDNRINGSPIFHLDEGAIFDGNGKWSTLGGFTGRGVVTNLPSNSNLNYVSRLCAGPLDFAGRVYGPIVLAPSTGQVVGDEGYLCVGASDTLAEAPVTLAGDAVYTNMLRFASGVGAFEIQSLDFGTKSNSVVLVDTDGDPITLKIGDVSIIGAANQFGTAVLDLQNGVMDVKGDFKQPSSGTISALAEGKILFNDSVMRAVGSGDQSWWTGSRDPDERVKAYVGAAGATMDVQASSPSRSVTVGWPFVSGVANGIDGGLVKLGLGKLVLAKPYAATGFVDVREGGVSAATSSSATEFGTAGVRIGGGYLEFTGGNPISVSATSGASLSYTNCATLRLASGVALTIGDAGAAADSAIVREGHGVLTVMSGTAEEALGVNASVTVNGGLSNDATTGILRQPIFERRSMSANNTYRARLLKCENNALVPASPVEFDPATSSTSTVAQITGDAVTVSANASVGALVVERSTGAGLTVNDGVTLSVGPNTAGSVAPILLNSVDLSAGEPAKAGISGVGTIDFGASEGLIVLNGNASIWYPVNIDNAIAGSGGVTFAAPTLFSDGIRGCVVLNKAGAYTGGTWIENAHVSTTADGSFGSGTIHVSGGELEGGALEIAAKYNSNTFTNQIEIAGNGPVYSKNLPGYSGYYGALIVSKGGVTLSGGVTLAADAKIASGARGGQKPVTFSAPIVGLGKLTVSGMSPFRFDAANTYAGGTVIVNGTVEVTDAGTLGSGPVEVCAGGVLRFVNTSAKTVANVITGDGRIEMNGAAVTLTSADGFKGDIAGNFAAPGDGGYVKAGEGTVSLTNSLSYAGATTVLAGTLRLGPAPLGVPAASESIAFRLDASDGDTITEDDGAVVSWSDADGRDIAFTNVVANGPSRAVEALNGKDALYFNGEKGRRLIANAATPEFRTVFFVNCVTNDTRPSGTKWDNMGIFGELNKDNGLRFRSQKEITAESIKADSMFFDGVLRIDGVSSMYVATQYDSMSVPKDKFVVTEAEVAIPVQNVTFAIGDYKNGNPYFGDIAEVIAYDRWLTDEERIATERYLQNKWGLKEVAANDVFTNLLPVATALTVADGATLDLAGGYQEVASLSGAGTIANSFETQATLVLSSGTSEFSGSFSGDIYLEVAEGATLDLCGGTVTVAGIGGSGRICNGTVVVTGEIQPGGRGTVGTLTFETAPVVSGATLVVDGNGAGGVDSLVVEGDFVMTGLSLSVPMPKTVAPGDHAVVVSGGVRSGEFAATDLPNNGKWSVGYTESAAVLSREKPGMLFIIQ